MNYTQFHTRLLYIVSYSISFFTDAFVFVWLIWFLNLFNVWYCSKTFAKLKNIEKVPIYWKISPLQTSLISHISVAGPGMAARCTEGPASQRAETDRLKKATERLLLSQVPSSSIKGFICIINIWNTPMWVVSSDGKEYFFKYSSKVQSTFIFKVLE